MVWHDGPDFAEFRETARVDSTTAERVLLEGLAQGDGLAAESVAHAEFSAELRARFVPR
jgi:hypothetical protein